MCTDTINTRYYFNSNNCRRCGEHREGTCETYDPDIFFCAYSLFGLLRQTHLELEKINGFTRGVLVLVLAFSYVQLLCFRFFFFKIVCSLLTAVYY